MKFSTRCIFLSQAEGQRLKKFLITLHFILIYLKLSNCCQLTITYQLSSLRRRNKIRFHSLFVLQNSISYRLLLAIAVLYIQLYWSNLDIGLFFCIWTKYRFARITMALNEMHSIVCSIIRYFDLIKTYI